MRVAATSRKAADVDDRIQAHLPDEVEKRLRAERAVPNRDDRPYPTDGVFCVSKTPSSLLHELSQAGPEAPISWNDSP